MMQINVAATPGPVLNLANLQAYLPQAFKADQPPIIAPQRKYDPVYGTTTVKDTYTKIQSNTITVPPTTQAVKSVAIVSGGAGYTSAPAVTFVGGGGTCAATASVSAGVVTGIALTAPCTGYNDSPAVVIADPPAGAGNARALATAYMGAMTVGLPVIQNLQPKAIHELFTTDYGRMNALLGVELPFTNWLTQTTIPLSYIDPPTEIFSEGENQFWKITHNGVDTHAVHFHLFNVQIINRVGWDGAVRLPESSELGWKETVRMNPLEDAIVTMRPYKQVLPPTVGVIPQSIRPLDTTTAVGTSGQFTNIDPLTNNPINITNQNYDFGWEYVWHCHLLGHEENDMMRPIVFRVNVAGVPSNLTASAVAPTQVNLAWIFGGTASGYQIQRRAVAGGGPFTTIATTTTPATAYSDVGAAPGTTYDYQVIALITGVPSGTSNIATVTTPLNPPASLAVSSMGRGFVILRWTDSNPTGATGFYIERAVGLGAFVRIGSTTNTATTTFRDGTTVAGTTYRYRVQAYGPGGLLSTYSNTLQVVGQ